MINLIIFLFFVVAPADFDLGWHLKYGEYFWNQGRYLWENTFSSTFPQFVWVNHSWLYDIFLYPVFAIGGFLGTAILAALFMFILLKIIFKTVKATPVEELFGVAVLAFFGIYSLGLGLRSRFPSLVIFAILYWVIERGRKKFYYFYLLPPMFILWANLHGTYTQGLLFLALTWAVGLYDVVSEPKKHFYFWMAFGGIVALSGVASLINPFGPAIFGEALELVGNPYRQLVLEYAPLLSLNNPIGPLLIVYSLMIPVGLFINKKKEYFKEYFLEAIVLLPFAYLAFDAIRNMAVFLILSIPLIIKLYRPLEIKIHPSIWKLIMIAVLTALVFRLGSLNLLNFTWEDYCRFSTKCSVKAVQYLKANPPKGQPFDSQGKGFNFYDWGGFMIWKIPEVKPFIDGRMHLWHTGDAYIMNTYMQTLQGQGDIEKVFKDFDFSWAMVPPGWGIVEKLDSLVKDNKWKMVYQDQLAIIYIRL